MKKILVVVDSINVDDSSGSKTNVAFIESLKKANDQITVLHYTQKEVKLNGINCVSIYEKKFTFNYFLSRIHRKLCRWFQIDVSKYVDSLLGFSFGFFNDVDSISNALQNYKQDDFEMLWTFGKGTSFRAHAAVLKNPSWFSKWYAYVHDPYPKHLYPRPYNFVEYGFKKKRYFFREITIKAHRLVFPSLLLKEWMQSYFLHVEGKSLIIPHQVVIRNFLTSELPDYFNKEKFNVLHAGNLLDLRNPKPIVEAFVEFLKEIPEAKKNASLLFLGKNSIFHEYLLDKQKYIPQIHISKDYVNFSEVYSMQQQASVNIILEAISEISPFLPGKFPHCVAANKPILVVGPYYSECKRLLGNEYPYVFDFKEVEGIKNAMKNLYQNWKDKSIILQLNRPDLVHYLSSEYLSQVLADETKFLQ